MSRLTRDNAGTERASRKDQVPDASYELAPEPPKPPREPQVHRRRPTPEEGQKPMELSKYAKHLLAQSITRFIDQTIRPNGAFENRNENRDLFLVSKLQTHNEDIKLAAVAAFETMQASKVPAITIFATLDSLYQNILKAAMYSVYLDYSRALRVAQGSMPDSFFEKLVPRRPAAENAEESEEDMHGSPDNREDEQEPPAGLATDYVTIGGFEWQIDDTEPLANRVAQGLEDLRIYLESVRAIHQPDNKERLPFFVELIDGVDWKRHDGNVYDALLAYEQKIATRNRDRTYQREQFFADQRKRYANAV